MVIPESGFFQHLRGKIGREQKENFFIKRFLPGTDVSIYNSETQKIESGWIVVSTEKNKPKLDDQITVAQPADKAIESNFGAQRVVYRRDLIEWNQ